MFLPRVTPTMIACEKNNVWEKSAFLEWDSWMLLRECSIFFFSKDYSASTSEVKVNYISVKISSNMKNLNKTFLS